MIPMECLQRDNFFFLILDNDTCSEVKEFDEEGKCKFHYRFIAARESMFKSFL